MSLHITSSSVIQIQILKNNLMQQTVLLKNNVFCRKLKKALYKINPDIPSENIDSVIRELCRDFSGSDMVKTNYDNYNLIRNGRKVEFKQNGKQTFSFVKLIDFENPETTFLLQFRRCGFRDSITDGAQM